MAVTSTEATGARVFKMNGLMQLIIALWVRLARAGWADASLWIAIGGGIWMLAALVLWFEAQRQ